MDAWQSDVLQIRPFCNALVGWDAVARGVYLFNSPQSRDLEFVRPVDGFNC